MFCLFVVCLGPWQTLLLEDGRPAWHADLWPPRAAEEVRIVVVFVVIICFS
jgi:hypothetical protein